MTVPPHALVHAWAKTRWKTSRFEFGRSWRFSKSWLVKNLATSSLVTCFSEWGRQSGHESISITIARTPSIKLRVFTNREVIRYSILSAASIESRYFPVRICRSAILVESGDFALILVACVRPQAPLDSNRYFSSFAQSVSNNS